MEFFQALGSLVNDRWKARNYNEAVFPEIATQALAELPPTQHISMWDAVRWGMTKDKLPLQDDIDAKFGDPPLTTYTGRKFRIEVLFWAEGIPAIHQHAFSGAFHVMHGSSIHSLWNFEPTEQIETRLLTGRVSFCKSEILLKGDSRPILAGNSMFHSTYHLDRPSISVVVRTLSEANKQPQYSLLPPTIADAPQHQIADVKRQVQILQMLLLTGKRAEFNEIARHLCATKDAYSIFKILAAIFSSVEDEEERQNLLHTARIRHRRFIDALEPALLQEEIGSKLLRVHKAIASAELKFFLALLRNVPERSAIFELVRQRFPDRDPACTIADWVGQVSQASLPTIRFERPSLLLLQHLLMDHSAPDILQALAEHCGPERVPSIAEICELCSNLQASWLLRSLCLNNPFNADTVAPTVNTVQNIQMTDHQSRDMLHTQFKGSCAEREMMSATSYERSATDGYRCVLDTQPELLVPRALRQQPLPLNGHTWIVNPLLRFNPTGPCLDSDIYFSEGVTAREPMVWVSDPVTSIVSPFVLGPTLTPIVSSLRPGRELSELPPPDIMQQMAEAGLIDEPDRSETKRYRWRTSLQRAQAKFEIGYVALGALLHPFMLGSTRAYFRRLIQQGGARYGDRQVPRRWAAHNEPVARFILHQLTPIVEAVAGVPIKPSYAYFASYYDGAKLARHTDREQCEYSMSMLIDYSPEPDAVSPWPLWLDTRDGSTAIHQRLGDSLIYRGRQLSHYREQLPAGHTSTHLFLHYVPRDFTGPLD